MLLIVRHGQTDFNVDRRFQGQMDVPLNAKGLSQANIAAEVLRHRIGEQALASQRILVQSSPLPRARQTADVLFDELQQFCPPENAPTLTDHVELIEKHVGDFTGKTIAELWEESPTVLSTYLEALRADPLLTKPPGEGAESFVEVCARVVPLLRDVTNVLRESPSTIYVWCSHGWTINSILELVDLPWGADSSYIGNCDILILKPNPLRDYKTPTGRAVGYHMGWDVVDHIKTVSHLDSIKPIVIA